MKPIHSHTIFYFLGIGGIGMSALARFFHTKGHHVLGYDKTPTALTHELEMEGMEIVYDDQLHHLPSLITQSSREDIWVCYTPAIPKDNQIYQWFLRNEMEMFKRSELLGAITRRYNTIAIAGTHGKTTTSSLLTHLLTEGGFPVNAFLGGIANNFQSNCVMADSDWVVVEADEFDRSFLTLSPKMAAITAVDPDHLDIYGTEESFYQGFQQFAEKIQSGGVLIAKEGIPLDWKNLNSEVKVTTYALQNASAYAENVHVQNGTYVFDYVSEGVIIREIVCGLPGIHNVENAIAAITLALQCGVNPESLCQAMASFKGVRRRFDRVLSNEEVVVIDDYAHHPTEIQAAVQSVRELYPGKNVIGIFQPHLFSRTRDFGEGFAHALSQLDEVILLPIYPARELPIEGIDSQWLLDKISNPSKKLLNKSELLEIEIGVDWQVVIFLGAGDIDQLVVPLTKRINECRA